MDPMTLAAIGLAGNIVQFIDFGCRVLSKAHEIRQEGVVVENRHLQVVTADLLHHTTTLKDGIANRPDLGTQETSLIEVCAGCLQIAERLETALQKLRRRETARDGRASGKPSRASMENSASTN